LVPRPLQRERAGATAERPTGRPLATFLSWSEDDGRTHEIAAALGGEARSFYDLGIVAKPLVPIRYALSAIRTAGYLAARRQRAVIVTNPPIFPPLIALAYAKLARIPFVLDSHPSCFDASEALVHRLTALHAWVARRAVTTLVTVDELAAVVESWPLNGRMRVLYIGRFAGDEPTEEVIEAARVVPEIDVDVTGDPRKCSPELRRDAPANVTFTGFLRGDDYPRAIESANALLVLTRRLDAVNRAAYEAVYAGRPLVVSGTPPMRRLFPYGVHVENDAAGIAAGLRDAAARHAELVAAAGDAIALQQERWEGQLDVLRKRIGC
jgi:glycosyltransferase involved in cell wall biosynthesis